MSSALDDLYREVILDHYRSPRGRKQLERKDIVSVGHNPACGDVLNLCMLVENDNIAGVHIDCQGCAISVASASMLAETVEGMSLRQAGELAEDIRKMLTGKDIDLPEQFADLDALRGVRQFPVRVKCALLAWMTLLDGMSNYKNGHGDASSIVSTENEIEKE